ncbi:coproporphyrinogen dehydrogenase HemZ [Clostridiales bacterium oral taxon 876 str. F0540]|nr:coproporphyrinogen dehydrogenase HemZ [Clostridiales bacterium oral taxon 876 str. F0540]
MIIIKVNLNKQEFRYDVYQIINLFYNLEEIIFIDENADMDIDVNDEYITIKHQNKSYEFLREKEIKLKEAIKLAVYSFLSSKTNIEFPWGTLIGIRPSKIALNLINKGVDESNIINYYDKMYKTSSDKTQLCIDIAKLEKNFVNANSDTVSVYIGMPFCPTRCLYCSFASNPIVSCNSLVEPYLAALSKEIQGASEYIEKKGLKVECIYFGGGTPTSVNDQQFEAIMNVIYKNLVLDKNIKEFTVECGRPDSITENKLITMKKYNVHRISINPQTMNDETLKKIGRHHTADDVVHKFNMARRLGFDNINMDIIVGLTGERLSHIDKTCNALYELNPDSITVHGLSVKRASKLHENLLHNKIANEINQLEINKMYERTTELARSLKMKPYYMYRQKNMFGNMENVGYAKPSKEGIYNIEMIEEQQTIIALGADAVSKVVFPKENRIERHGNVKDVREYINRIDEMISKKNNLLSELYK